MRTSTSTRSGRLSVGAGGLLLLALGTSTGCQIDVAGQTLPSPYHLTDDVQFYAPGPEFKLSREAAALAEQRAQEISEPQLEGATALPPRPAAPVPPVDAEAEAAAAAAADALAP